MWGHRNLCVMFICLYLLHTSLNPLRTVHAIKVQTVFFHKITDWFSKTVVFLPYLQPTCSYMVDPGVHYLAQNVMQPSLFSLKPSRKKWGGMMSPSLLRTSKTMLITGNCLHDYGHIFGWDSEPPVVLGADLLVLVEVFSFQLLFLHCLWQKLLLSYLEWNSISPHALPAWWVSYPCSSIHWLAGLIVNDDL